MGLFPKTPGNGARGQRRARRAPIATYYRSGADSGSASPFKKKTPKKNHRKLVFGAIDIILIILLVAGLGYSLVVNPKPKIIANDYSYHSSKTYTAAAAAELGAVKNRNKVTFDEQSVVKALQQRFPEVSSAQVELPFFSQQPTIRLDIAPPSFKLTSGGVTYIIDVEGVVAAKTADLPGVRGLFEVVDQSGFQAAVGKQILNHSATAFINTVTAECRRAKVPISSLTLPAVPQELDLRTSDQPYFVKFYMGGDALTQSGQFLAARTQFARNHQTPSQYLDVRVSGKIFYK